MQSINHPEFDLIHDSQVIYRSLLDSMARPGRINDLSRSLNKMDTDAPCPRALLAIALTLLDREVAFHLIASNKENAIKHIEWMTGSSNVDTHQADYVFVASQPDQQFIDTLMDRVRIGTLLDPDHSATLIILVDELSDHDPLSLDLRLQGPGIQTTKNLFISGLHSEWMIKRALLNKEYPTGCDFIFITESGKLAAIPRTTIIESECY